MRKNIALVDDDRNILTSVSMLLEAEGFQIKTYTDGASALEGLNQSAARPRHLRHQDAAHGRHGAARTASARPQQFPVIFLTSKDEEIDEVLGLRMGADDYIRKPFSQRLLLERIRAVLRRADGGGAKGEAAAERIVRGELVLDPSRHQCTWKGKEVHLTVTEFLLLKSLAERPGHVKNRDQLMDAAYGETIYVDDRTIDSHIKRVRHKFREVDGEFEQIETLYGIGYRYRDA